MIYGNANGFSHGGLSGADEQMITGFLLWLIFWLLPMVISGTLASRQGRSVILWLVLTFFFGWIPTIILLALSGI